MRGSMTRPVVLCIEDEEDLRIDIADELKAADYEVLQAANGNEALKLLESARPDLVLCDITMPGLGGYEVLKAMRGEGDLSDVPFIFLTALADRNDVLVGKQAGADDYLVKPIDHDLLLATIATRLNQVSRVRSGAALRAEEAWRQVLASSRGQTIEALRKATLAFDRFLIGVVIVDRTGNVRIMNSEAERIIGQDDGLSLSQGALRSISGKQTTHLNECIEKAFHEATADEIIPLPKSSGGRPYLLLVPGQRTEDGEPEAVVLLLIDAEQRTKISGDTLVRLYNLTPAETRVALMLIDGKRLDQVAEELEIAQTTVVFHLKNLFRTNRTMLRSALTMGSRSCQSLGFTRDFPTKLRNRGTRSVARPTALSDMRGTTI
jgi:DNA-binding response OmpR family regulator/DNA-binding CsgD family transcriptional regulator